jgi:hypothetical protein
MAHSPDRRTAPRLTAHSAISLVERARTVARQLGGEETTVKVFCALMVREGLDALADAVREARSIEPED